MRETATRIPRVQSSFRLTLLLLFPVVVERCTPPSVYRIFFLYFYLFIFYIVWGRKKKKRYNSQTFGPTKDNTRARDDRRTVLPIISCRETCIRAPQCFAEGLVSTQCCSTGVTRTKDGIANWGSRAVQYTF